MTTRKKLVEIEEEVTGDDPGDETSVDIRTENVTPLSDDEIVEIRYQLFGICPRCGNFIRDWSPGAFHAERIQYWHEIGLDPVTGHKKTCPEKYRR